MKLVRSFAANWNLTPATAAKAFPARMICRVAAVIFGGLLFFADPALAHAGRSATADATGDHFRPGQFLWEPELASSGTMTMVIDLARQRAYVYRDGMRIGATTISSGKPGYETPTGVFTVLQKDKDHYSKKYHHAPMPYDLRLTWEGISVHGGHLPGYPASHGCVRLPIAFSRALFNEASMGMTVTITDRRESTTDEGLIATGTALRPQLAENEGSSLISPEVLAASGYQSAPPPAPAASSSGP
jgi:hypothetical protein